LPTCTWCAALFSSFDLELAIFHLLESYLYELSGKDVLNIGTNDLTP
jgi:hypothetical protein